MLVGRRGKERSAFLFGLSSREAEERLEAIYLIHGRVLSILIILLSSLCAVLLFRTWRIPGTA